MELQPTTQSAQRPSALSEDVIPAVRGEFYNYSATFSTDRPLGYLMKCRANKDRQLSFAEDHPEDLDLVFLFDGAVRVCSPDSVPAGQLLCELVDLDELNRTAIAAASITAEQFNQLRERRNGHVLAEAVRAAIGHRNDPATPLTLTVGAIIAVATKSGKFGLLHVVELTPTSVRFDACHILL